MFGQKYLLAIIWNFAYLEQNFHLMKQIKTKSHDIGGQYYKRVPGIYKMNVPSLCFHIFLNFFLYHVLSEKWYPCHINTLKYHNTYKPSLWRHFYLLMGRDRNTNSILLNSETFHDYKFTFCYGSSFKTSINPWSSEVKVSGVLATYRTSCMYGGNFPTFCLSCPLMKCIAGSLTGNLSLVLPSVWTV